MPTWRVQFLALAAIWGSSFLCIKVLGEDWAPVHVALGRVALGALTLLVILAVRRERLPREGALWGHLAVVGLFMCALPFTLFAYGETQVSSVLAGLWNATTPLLTLLVALAVLPEERPDRRRLAGLAAGFAGVAVILGPWRGLEGDELAGNLACLAAAACYGIGVPYTRRNLRDRGESGVALAAVQLLCAGGMLAVVAPFAGAPTLDLRADAVASLLVLGALGSGVAYVLMHAIIRAAGATTMSTVTYLIPVFSTALGVLVLGEGLSWNQPAGAAVVLAAVALTSTPPRRSRTIAEADGSLPDDQVDPGGQQHHARDLACANRVAGDTEPAELIDHQRDRQLRGDRRGDHRPGAEGPDRDEDRRDVDRPEDAAEQRPPRHAHRSADLSELASHRHERDQRCEPEGEGDARGRQ